MASRLRPSLFLALGVIPLAAPSAQPAVAPAGNVMQRPAAGALAPRFADPAAFDFARLLTPPPAPGSIAALADLESVLQAQASRTPEQVEWARLIERDHVFHHASVLGRWFTRENLPLTDAFFRELNDDLRWIDTEAKKPFRRPRPSVSHPEVQPCVTVGASTGYPSGTAIQAFAWAELLAEILPERRDQLVARAHRAAWGRVIGGVHYPSDLVAGRLLAAPLLAECRKNPAFARAFAACRAEILAAVAKAGP